MIPNHEPHSATSSATSSASFGISRKDEAHIMGILRDTLYSDKILAVLREYSANAWDAQRSAGHGDLPIEVTLPTHEDLRLRIRDRGPGLSRDDVFQVFTQYGASTKRDNDEVVGMLGIGSKSAFAYADNFTITSWHDGTKAIYVAALDESDRGVINLIHEECQVCGCSLVQGPCLCVDAASHPSVETGVEIQVAIQAEDIDAFEDRARNLFPYFEPRPEVNTWLPDAPSGVLSSTVGSVRTGDGEWVAVMGCIPYRIRLSELDLPNAHKCLHHLDGSLKFNIGDVQISASREELRYTKKTKEALLTKFTTLVDEYVADALAKLEGLSVWQRRLQVRVLMNMDIELPAEYEYLKKSWVKLFENAEDVGFFVFHAGGNTNQATVDDNLHFYLDDQTKRLKGYQTHRGQYIIKALHASTTLDELREKFNKVLEAVELTGVPIGYTSELLWTGKSRGLLNEAARAKHRATMFVLNPSETFKHPYSACWDTVTRVPEDTDVYVVLENFKGKDFDHFYASYREDESLAKLCDVEMPKIYGYKHTTKKPVDVSKLTGVEYRTWRNTFIASLATPERIAKFELVHWYDVVPHPGAEEYKFLKHQLGKDSVICQLIAKEREAFGAMTTTERDALRQLAIRLGHLRANSEAQKALDEVHARYPLLKHARSTLRSLWETWWGEDKEQRKEWCRYVKLIDQALALATESEQVTQADQEVA